MGNRFYNTAGETGGKLKECQHAVVRQERAILAFMEGRPGQLFTAREVLAQTLPFGTPLTSVHRSFSNLTDKGKLLKTDVMRKGPYGRKNHCWTSNTAIH